MKQAWWVGGLLVLSLFAGWLTFASGLGKAPAVDQKEGETAPDFTLPNLKGEKVTLSALRGKIVFLNFWATWCPPCLAEMPSMQKLHQSLEKQKDFVMLAVSVDQSDRREIAKFVAQNGFTFPILHDAKNEIMMKYGIRGIPTTFIIDRKGKILTRQIGDRDWAKKEVMNAIQALLKLT